MSAAEYRAAVVPKKRSKFGAVPVYRCAICQSPHVFRLDSKAEGGRWDKLISMQKAGLISGLRRQVPYEIKVDSKTMATYFLDFQYLDRDGTVHYEDVKGGKATQTPTSKLKIKLVEAQHGIRVDIVT